jgi:hypothetical protein
VSFKRCICLHTAWPWKVLNLPTSPASPFRNNVGVGSFKID